MGSLNVLAKALSAIAGNVDSLKNQSGSTFTLVEAIAKAISDPIVAAVNALTVSTSVDFTPVTNSLTTLDADLKSHVDAMSAAIIASVNAKSPIQKASIATLREILTAAIPANTPVKLMDANPNRVAFCVYNNSTNSLYGGPTNSPAGGRVLFQLASNAGPTALQWFLGPTVWTGEVWVLRNAGTGGVVGYELVP